jgi:hypothetical protein
MYPIKSYQVAQAKKLGVTIKPSTKGNFKLDVYKDDKYLTSIGHKDYKDYATYLEEYGKAYADERRRLYHKRHKKEGIRGQLSKLILWT